VSINVSIDVSNNAPNKQINIKYSQKEVKMKKSRGARTIVFPTPIFIVGTYDKEGKPNAMAVAWGGICCSRPPCVCISVRKATYTYGNLIQQKAFTVNIPDEKHVIEADYFGLVSGRTVDKFAETGLTPVKSDFVNAPYINEFPLNVSCQVVEFHELGLHTLFVGEILDVAADEDVFTADGKFDMNKIKPFWWAPDDGGYYGIGTHLGQGHSIGNSLKKS
jgi:flavin reductase (DIM6/NTAB) family NADH-FMN oxidoreductase RutF